MDVEIQFYDANGVVGDTELASLERDAREVGDSVQYVHGADGVGASLVLFGAAGLSFLKKIVPRIFKWLGARERRSVSLEFGGVTVRAKGPHSHDTILKVLEIIKPAGSELAQMPQREQVPALPQPVKVLATRNKKAKKKLPAPRKKKRRR